MKPCIWCKTPNNSKAIEHIIPEALGCPDEFIFSDGTVCERCNNKLGHIDRAVIDEYDLILFQHGVPRKKGRSPAVRSRGNFIADYDQEGKKFMAINMNRDSVEGPDGSKIAGFKNSERNVNGSFEPIGKAGRISYSITFGKPKKFRRGIVKIAFSSIAYFLGSNQLLSSEYDGIRRFVKSGYGDRPILLTKNDDLNFKNQVWSPFERDDFYGVTFRLGPVEYFVDLSPDGNFFDELLDMKKRQSGDDSWTYLPIDYEKRTV